VTTEGGRTVPSDEREPSDTELLRSVAEGDEQAYGVLWQRHEAAARRLAAQITTPSNVDDLVSEGFLRVLRAVKAGGGPDTAFRPYLFNTMRRYNIDTGRSYHQRISLTPDDADLDVLPAEPAGEVFSADAERQAAWRAWESLPEDTRTLLWHLVVEEETPAQIAPLLGVSPNGVSSRAVRAKERLRQAFLTQHLAAADTEECRRTRAGLGAYVRDALSTRDRTAADRHLAECRRCTAALAEVRDVNTTMRIVILPLLLGGAAVAERYLAAAAHSGGAAAGTASATVLPGHVRRIAAAAARPRVLVGGLVAAATASAGLALLLPGSAPDHRAAAGPSARSAPAQPSGPVPVPAVTRPATGPSPSPFAPSPTAPSPASPGTSRPAGDRAPVIRREVVVRLDRFSAAPGAGDGTLVSAVLPAGWELTEAQGVPMPPGVHSSTWYVSGNELRLSLRGPDAGGSALPVHIVRPDGSTRDVRFPLA
jgi:RNA polymerase sigma factor (sigma-70 family)